VIRSLRLVVVLLFTAVICHKANAQVTTGVPPLGSFTGGPDVIDLANLNAHFDIPVLEKPGRGTPFSYDLTYDSSVWSKVGSVWTPAYNWGWTAQTAIATGFLSYGKITYNCDTPPPIHQYYVFNNFVYHDAFGGIHRFYGQMEYDPTNCDNGTFSSLNAVATDASGYSISASISGPNLSTHLIASPGGSQFSNVPLNLAGGYSGTTAMVTDRNGNEISVSSTSNTATFTDTLGKTAVTVSGTGSPSSPLVFGYTDSLGNPASYTMKFTTYSIRTNFGCSGVTDYGTNGTTTAPLVSEIDLPDGVSKYTFTYEQTPGHSGFYTGRLASITLPTGGTISYTYSGGGTGVNGINCADGSAMTLTRVTPDGTWTYARTLGTAAASATLITAPQLPYDSASNQTIAQFQGIYPTQTDTYQGAAPTFTSLPISETTLKTSGLLQEVQTCYNASASPCPSIAITLPITQRTVTASLDNSGALWSQHTDKYNTYGLQTESDDYDFAATPPGTRLQQTTVAYATLGGYLSAFPQTVEVLNSAGTIQSRQDTAYDGVALTCRTGVTQHDDTDYPCTYNVRGNATSVTTYTNPTVPSGGITKNFTYDSTGNLLTAQVNCCELKTWVYSSTTDYAYPDSVTSGSSTQLTTTMTYDLNMGLLLTSTDPNNLKATLTYDNLGRPLTSITGSNPAATTAYNDSGTWTVLACSPVQSTNTACQKTIADSQGRTATTQLLDGSSDLYSAADTKYDSWGRAYKVSNPYTTSAAYWTQTNTDAIGRTVKTTLQDGSVSTSSYTDNAVTVTDPAGKQRKGISDALGRLTSVYEPDPTNGNSLTLLTSYTYNVFNQLTNVSQSVQTRSYVYDALGRLSSSTTPEAGTVCIGTYSGSTCQANGYDQWNNLVYRTDARYVVTNYLYDSLNRLTGITYPTVPAGVTAMPNVCEANGAPSNNANVCFTYGTSASSYNNGLPLSMTDATGSETYTYNALEQVTQLQKTIGTTVYNTGYAYNYAGELTQITYPSGRIVTENLDVIGRLCAVGTSGSTCSTGTTWANNFTYNAAQQPTAYTLYNGVSVTLGYSPDRLQLTSLSYAKSGTTIFGLSYLYGASGSNDGLISSITDNVQSGRSVSYTYDGLARLSTALTSGSSSYPQWGLQWYYDRYGNRTQQAVTNGSGPSNSVTVNATTNQLTGSTFTYDLSGNMTNDGSNTLVYDAENRATGATNSGSTGAYTYDGKSQRVTKCVASCTSSTRYIFSGSKVIAEYASTASPSAPTIEYIYAGGTLIASEDNTSTYRFYQRDHLSNRVVTDINGNVLEQLGHYPSGESWYNSAGEKLIFTTYERDAESGNDYAQARYYASRLGRFSAVDPVAGSTADPQTLNGYAYVRNVPTMLVDPAGLCPTATVESYPSEDPQDQSGHGPYMSDVDSLLSSDPQFKGGAPGPCPGGPATNAGVDSYGGISSADGGLTLDGGYFGDDSGFGVGSAVAGGDIWDLLSIPVATLYYAGESLGYASLPGNSYFFSPTFPDSGNPCAGYPSSALDYLNKFQTANYKDGSPNALVHIIANHILPMPGKSIYNVPEAPPYLELPLAVMGMLILNAKTYELATPTVSSNGNTLTFQQTFKEGDELGVYPSPDGPITFTVGSSIGNLRNKGGPTLTNTLLVSKDCITVLTSFPGTLGD
jgi:RHS repeat-associated protein